MKALRVRRTFGLGDQIFALGAAAGCRFEQYGREVQFIGNEELVSHLRGVESGRDEPPYVDLDNADPQHPGDRSEQYAALLGARLPRFPLDWRQKPCRGGYTVIAPWCAGAVPTRSLSPACVRDLCARVEDPVLVHHHPMPAPGLGPQANLTGRLTLTELVNVLASADRVIAVDAGTAYLAASMGKPTTVIFTHIAPAQRVKFMPWAKTIRADLPCSPCGDFVWPNCACQGTDGFAACGQSVTAEMILGAEA